jgi:hypothetical protein
VGQGHAWPCWLHGPCSRAIEIRWPGAIVSASPRRARAGGRARKKKARERPGNSPAGGGGSTVTLGRSGGVVGSSWGVLTGSPLAPAAPPSSPLPAAGLGAAGSGRPSMARGGLAFAKEGRAVLVGRREAGGRWWPRSTFLSPRRRPWLVAGLPRAAALSGALGALRGGSGGSGGWWWVVAVRGRSGAGGAFYRQRRATGGRRTVAMANQSARSSVTAEVGQETSATQASRRRERGKAEREGAPRAGRVPEWARLGLL